MSLRCSPSSAWAVISWCGPAQSLVTPLVTIKLQAHAKNWRAKMTLLKIDISLLNSFSAPPFHNYCISVYISVWHFAMCTLIPRTDQPVRNFRSYQTRRDELAVSTFGEVWSLLVRRGFTQISSQLLIPGHSLIVNTEFAAQFNDLGPTWYIVIWKLEPIATAIFS